MTAPAIQPHSRTTGAASAHTHSRARILTTFPGASSLRRNWTATPGVASFSPLSPLHAASAGGLRKHALNGGDRPSRVTRAAFREAGTFRKSGRSSWPDATQDEFPAKPLPGAAPINARRFSRMTFNARHAAKPMRSMTQSDISGGSK